MNKHELKNILIGQRHAHQPVEWATKSGYTLWTGQKNILESLENHTATAAQTCHGIGKTFLCARAAEYWILTHPIGEAFVLSTAPTYMQVKALLWEEMRRGNTHLPGEINLNNEWRIGNQLVAIGKKPSDYRDGDFQGHHAKYLLVIIDEAGGVSETIWTGVKSLLTGQFNKLLAVGNPDDPNSSFRQFCEHDADKTFKIDAFSTPNFSGEKVPEYVSTSIISRDWVEKRRKEWGETDPRYIAKVLAEFPPTSLSSFFSRSELQKLTENVNPTTPLPLAIGVDVARFGSNESVIVLLCDNSVSIEYSTQGANTQTLINKVIQLVESLPTTPIIAVDGVGVGGGVTDQLIAKGYNIIDIQSSGKPDDTNNYVNRRAEIWGILKQQITMGNIQLPTDPTLLSQLSQIEYSYTSAGKMLMGRKGKNSPDRADALAYAVAAATTAYRETKGSKKLELTPNATKIDAVINHKTYCFAVDREKIWILGPHETNPKNIGITDNIIDRRNLLQKGYKNARIIGKSANKTIDKTYTFCYTTDNNQTLSINPKTRETAAKVCAYTQRFKENLTQ